MYIGEETLFQELFYNISDKVAKYLIDGIYKDLDAESMFESTKTKDKKVQESLNPEVIELEKSLYKFFTNCLKHDKSRRPIGIECGEALLFAVGSAVHQLILNNPTQMDFRDDLKVGMGLKR